MRGMDRREFLQASVLTAAEIALPDLRAQKHEDPPVLETDIYVAPHGNDKNSGTRKEPLASLERAKLEVRMRKKHVQKPLTVWMRAGTYYLDRPLLLASEDSGSMDAPITYASFPGEVATLSGGRRLTCDWRPFRDGIMHCTLSRTKGLQRFSQLFVNGKRRIRARYPKYDQQNPLVDGTGYLDVAHTSETWPASELHYDPATFTRKKWNRPREAVVHLFPLDRWGNLQWEVQDVDRTSHAIKLGWGGFQLNELLFGKAATGIGRSEIYSRGFQSRFFVENVFEELDAPSEWYLDGDQGVLYYLPEAGEDLKAAPVEAPVLERIIEVRGSQRQSVQFVNFSGFRVAHTASTFLSLYEAPSLGDWTIHRGGAVFLEGTENCHIEKMFFDQVGGNAVFLSNFNRWTVIYGNRFTAPGDSAVCLVGCASQVQGSNRPIPSESVVANNLIHDCGYFGKQCAGVFLSVAEKTTISHNHIFNMPRAAICANDGWGGGNVIEWNHIHDTVRETTDHGPFNSWGRGRFWCMDQSHGDASHGSGYPQQNASYPFAYEEADGAETILRHNLFREPLSIHQLGIDLDDGSSHYHIYGNLCIGIGIKLREGDYRVVENNIFFHPANPPAFHQGYEGNRDRFRRNIVVTDSKENQSFGKSSVPGDLYQVRYPPRQGSIAVEIDSNLFFSDLGEFFASITPRGGKRIHHTFEQWRSQGYDRQSLYADPKFVDPENGDFALRPDSPAYEIGFTPFDLSSAGLLDDFPAQWRIPSNGRANEKK
jgi:parallel beta helix pectate lyase-like protein